ncbi:methyltransferase domain-containing protein [Marinomonas sp. C2222]|uniref:Methyltransferase domain-containing protein n=1 Tax=Marinomonas sargassi TaxID=2984494 RepID=A0ABT2YQN7_9GAMM|nr:methyltransferase domain-containing protein [Marinomonas sargassi]MCV2402207.1 methyltransferase domain-containing protein [Marinomonas sargassi]
MPDDQTRQFFQTWYETDLGKQLLAGERNKIESKLDATVGYYLITQSPLKVLPIDNHRLRKSFQVAPVLELGASCSTIVAKANELPFDSDGIDVHILHHTLDISETPHDDLREVARTLLPSGKLIIVGFNPFGLWGFFRLFANKNKAPWCARFIAPHRLEDWLKVAGLTLESKSFIHYELPLQSGTWRSRFKWIDKILRPLKLPFSGVYILTATKQVKRYTPMKPVWTRPRVRVSPLTKPTIKEMRD